MTRAALLLLALTACGGRDGELVRAVRAYDDALVRAYRTGDASGLDRLADAAEARRIEILVGLKSASRLVLEASLEALEVTRAERGASPAAATVETRERWRYVDRPLDPGRSPGAAFVKEMTVRYALVRDGGAWKVQRVAVLESRDGAPAPPAPGEPGAER